MSIADIQKPEPAIATTLSAPTGANADERLLAHLEAQLDERSALVGLYEAYYEGRHRLAFATGKFREVFANMLAAVSDNWCPVVIRASVERLHVQGFRLANRDSDKAAWEIWQRNELDEGADLAFAESAKHGESYLLVWHDDLDPGRARITPEHPSQMIVMHAPGDRTRVVAALKRWWQPDEEAYFAAFWTPERVYRLRRGRTDTWWKDRTDVPEETNPLGVVPVVPLVNDPQMLPSYPPTSLLTAPHYVPADAHVGLGRSDLADVISTQDQINKLLCDLLVASELAAFKQRWASGLEVPRDKETGEPIEPFRSAMDRLWVSENPETTFGEFGATDLTNYLKAIEQRMQSLASRKRVPPHYLLGGMGSFPSGESLRAAETGLVAVVRDKQRSYGGGLRRAMALAFEVEGSSTDAFSAEVDWVQPESRTESEYVDSLVKKLSIGVPVQQLWEDYGYSPQQIERFGEMLREYAVLGLAIQPPLAAPGLPAAPVVEAEAAEELSAESTQQ